MTLGLALLLFFVTKGERPLEFVGENGESDPSAVVDFFLAVSWRLSLFVTPLIAASAGIVRGVMRWQARKGN